MSKKSQPNRSEVSQIISFFHHCYRSDNREENLLNIFSQKVSYRHFFETEDYLFNGMVQLVTLAGNGVRELINTLEVQKQEKQLVAGFMYVVGAIPSNQQYSQLCSPLWLGPVEITQNEEVVTVQIDLDQMRLNYPLIQELAKHGGSQEAQEVLEKLIQEAKTFPINEQKILSQKRFLSQTFPFLDTRNLASYPLQFSETKLKRAMKKKGELAGLHLEILPASNIMMIKRSVNTRGVLSELMQISKQATVSAPLQNLLNPEESTKNTLKKSNKKRNPIVPVILSPRQQKVIENAHCEIDSLVIGPPGTGKSFSIATLALDFLNQGKSVLIASKTNQAVDVIADKIEQILGTNDFIIRGGRKQYQKKLKHFINNLLMGIQPFGDLKTPSQKAYRKLRSRLAKLERRLIKLSQKLQSWGEWKEYQPQGFLETKLQKFQLWRYETYLNSETPYWQLMAAYQNDMRRLLSESKAIIQHKMKERLERAIKTQRGMFKDFYKAIIALRSSRRESFFRQIDFHEIFNAFPIWMVNISDISNVLPLKKELFDIVIFDEATQCDMASSLPVIYRAKKMVLIGDPHQLNHVSFLSTKRQERFARKYGIKGTELENFNYRKDSILDLASNRVSGQKKITFLDEHFRSLPPIIKFSNQEFYSGKLKMMQERPQFEDQTCLFLIHTGGIRVKSGANPVEADMVIQTLKDILATQKSWPISAKSSLGILSPFSDQVAYLTNCIVEQIPSSSIKEHRIAVGTPYNFQGEEREVMLLSLCLDDESHPSAFQYLEQKDVFNVAITRARNMQMVFHSFHKENVSVKPLLKKYLDFIENETNLPNTSTDPSKDRFLEQVGHSISKLDWKWWPNFPIAGFHVDMVVQSPNGMFGIDLIGYPGDYGDAFQLEQYRLFNRAGFTVFPLPYYSWVKAPDACIKGIQNHLQPS